MSRVTTSTTVAVSTGLWEVITPRPWLKRNCRAVVAVDITVIERWMMIYVYVRIIFHI